MTCTACHRLPGEPCCYTEDCPHSGRDARLARARAIAAEAAPRVKARRDYTSQNTFAVAYRAAEERAIAMRVVAAEAARMTLHHGLALIASQEREAA